MNDFIKRQDAIDCIERYRATSQMPDLLSWTAVRTILEHVPSAEPERKTGKWLGRPIAGKCTVKCSACSEVFLENSGEWNFCPNCGADMRGER